MDKDRIKGAMDQAKGATKDAAGKITGDAKLQAEGKMDKLKGKAESTFGSAKDALHDASRKHDESRKH
ncbi:MAG TPA: CsbD family protein [Rhizomicrobium sp.]|nr:CsbD family protein [Rhizomicrobium sp.]